MSVVRGCFNFFDFSFGELPTKSKKLPNEINDGENIRRIEDQGEAQVEAHIDSQEKALIIKNQRIKQLYNVIMSTHYNEIVEFLNDNDLKSFQTADPNKVKLYNPNSESKFRRKNLMAYQDIAYQLQSPRFQNRLNELNITINYLFWEKIEIIFDKQLVNKVKNRELFHSQGFNNFYEAILINKIVNHPTMEYCVVLDERRMVYYADNQIHLLTLSDNLLGELSSIPMPENVFDIKLISQNLICISTRVNAKNKSIICKINGETLQILQPEELPANRAEISTRHVMLNQFYERATKNFLNLGNKLIEENMDSISSNLEESLPNAVLFDNGLIGVYNASYNKIEVYDYSTGELQYSSKGEGILSGYEDGKIFFIEYFNSFNKRVVLLDTNKLKGSIQDLSPENQYKVLTNRICSLKEDWGQDQVEVVARITMSQNGHYFIQSLNQKQFCLVVNNSIIIVNKGLINEQLEESIGLPLNLNGYTNKVSSLSNGQLLQHVLRRDDDLLKEEIYLRRINMEKLLFEVLKIRDSEVKNLADLQEELGEFFNLEDLSQDD